MLLIQTPHVFGIYKYPSGPGPGQTEVSQAAGLILHAVTDRLHCVHSDHCSVCSWIDLTGTEQSERKTKALTEHLKAAGIPSPPVQFHSAGLSQVRDRVDLTFESGKLGFFRRDSKEIFNLQECPLMSEALFLYFQEVQKIQWPIRKGSLRLRVSPQGQRGAWLDFANEDIRDLLAEKTLLQKLLDLGFVEIGQRRKKLSGNFKLVDPEFHPWTRTWSGTGEIPLFSLVGSFSQSGDRANQVLVGEIQNFLHRTGSLKWVEFGAGSGNLTFPAASGGRSVKALEYEPLALEGLRQTLQNHPEYQERIELSQGDYQRKAKYQFQKDEGILVNPPRSGLQKFLEPLFEIPLSERPRDFVYMSCFLESFGVDSKRLQELGYQLRDLSIVDQFPNSPHFEILSRWELPD